ncbi:MAG: hypothetical protein ACI4S3_00280 [Candidatus Gastranaerophilaceae bacterium]
MVERQNNSGMDSLGGFVFQIDTFIYYALKLNSNESIEYEAIDDVSIRKPIDLDSKEDSFRTNIIKSESQVAIQVKRTNITDDVVERVLMNWILLESSDLNIENYILFGDSSYSNNGNVNDIDNEALHEKIKANKEKSSKSITKQLKLLYANDFERFNEIVNNIKSKYKLEIIDSMENILINEAKSLFHKDGVMDAVYIARIKNLRSRIAFEILEAVKNKTSYKLEYKTFMHIIEEICGKYTDGLPLVSFSDYERANTIHINEIESRREVKQLKHCKLEDDRIIKRMHRCNYYADYRYLLRLQDRTELIKDIETTAFDNFEDVKERLNMNGEDEPYKRLTQTEDKENLSCCDKYIRCGVCIHLTKDISITGDKQISWKDEDNEES